MLIMSENIELNADICASTKVPTLVHHVDNPPVLPHFTNKAHPGFNCFRVPARPAIIFAAHFSKQELLKQFFRRPQKSQWIFQPRFSARVAATVPDCLTGTSPRIKRESPPWRTMGGLLAPEKKFCGSLRSSSAMECCVAICSGRSW